MKTSPGISADRQTFGKHRLRLLQAGCSLTLMVAWYSMEDKRGVTEARPGAMPSGSLPVARMVTFAHGKCRQRDSHMEVKAAGAVWFLPGSIAQMTEVPKKPHHRDPLKQERRHMCLPGSHHTPALNPTFILLLPPTHPLTHLPTPSSTHSSAPGPALPSPFLSSSHHCDAGDAANYSAHSTIQVTDEGEGGAVLSLALRSSGIHQRTAAARTSPLEVTMPHSHNQGACWECLTPTITHTLPYPIREQVTNHSLASDAWARPATRPLHSCALARGSLEQIDTCLPVRV